MKNITSHILAGVILIGTTVTIAALNNAKPAARVPATTTTVAAPAAPVIPAVSAESQAALDRSRELLPQVSQAMSNVQTYANQGDLASACASLQPAAAGYTELAKLFPQIPADKQQVAQGSMVELGKNIAKGLKICEQYGM